MPYLSVLYLSFMMSYLIVNNTGSMETTISSGGFSLHVAKKNSFYGDGYGTSDVLTGFEPANDGFNVTFRCSRNELEIKPGSNALEVSYFKESDHDKKTSTFLLKLSGGELSHVSADEIKRDGDIVTIVKIRLRRFSRFGRGGQRWLM
jgi:hypothetical protein